MTFFRTIGSSFGAAIFGSLFSNFLKDRIGPALAAGGVPASAVASPEALHRQPHSVAAPIVAAYADSLTQVFLCAAPVALLGFVLALFLREVPLRDIHNSAVDLGDGFGMPTSDTPERMLENAIARMLRGAPGMRLRSIAMRPDCRPDVAGLWGVMRIYRFGQMYGTARLSDIGDSLRIPFEVLEPTFARLVATGYVQREGRTAVADAIRHSAGRLRVLAAAGVDRRQAGPLAQLRGAAGPSRCRSRPGTNRASRSGST